MTTVGIRELRQNASELLAELAATGEAILITNRGRLVARLVPADSSNSATRDQLAAAGSLRPGRGDPLAVRPVTLRPGVSTADLLAGDRDDR